MNLFSDPAVGMLIVLLGGCFFVLAYLRPIWAVSGVLLLLPTYLIRNDFGGLPYNALDAVIWATFVGTALNLRFHMEWHGWGRVAILWLGAGILGVLVSPLPADALGQFKSVILEPLMVFFLLLNVIKTEGDRKYIVDAILASGLLLALVTITQYFWGYGIPEPWQAYPGRRATAWFGYPNAIGLYLAPVFACAFGLAIFQKKRTLSWWLAVATAALIPGAVWAAQTEGAMMALAASVIFFGLWTKQKWWFVGLAVIGLAGALAWPVSREILLFQDVSGDVRLALWSGTLDLLQARPFTGTGLAGFPYWYDQYRLDSHVELLNYSHNMLFDFWLQLTVLGVVAWGWLEYRFFSLLKPIKTTLNHPLLIVFAGAMLSILVYGFVDVPYFKNDLAVLFWSVVALFAVTKRWTKGQKNATI
ncbi:MAG: O-antigen ligase family protein [Patescibacteria group bacterium]